MTKPAFERVYTMTDYYDGPRAGIADFRGAPHAYSSIFDTDGDGYSDVFELRRVDDETLLLAIEDWEIWLRWEDAYHAGQVDLATHPALPEERARHEALQKLLGPRLEALSGAVVKATAEFRAATRHVEMGSGRWMEVYWTVINE